MNKRGIIYFIVLLTGLCTFFSSIRVLAQPNPKLQSVFIYNFIKYIEWPADYKSGDFIIGSLGDSPTTEELDKLAATRRAGTQKIVVQKYNSVGDIGRCHILFIPETKNVKMDDILDKVGGNSTLVITEKAGLIKDGASISFVYKDRKQEFELNKNNIQESGLKVSTNLLNLAIRVE